MLNAPPSRSAQVGSGWLQPMLAQRPPRSAVAVMVTVNATGGAVVISMTDPPRRYQVNLGMLTLRPLF